MTMALTGGVPANGVPLVIGPAPSRSRLVARVEVASGLTAGEKHSASWFTAPKQTTTLSTNSAHEVVHGGTHQALEESRNSAGVATWAVRRDSARAVYAGCGDRSMSARASAIPSTPGPSGPRCAVFRYAPSIRTADIGRGSPSRTPPEVLGRDRQVLFI